MITVGDIDGDRFRTLMANGEAAGEVQLKRNPTVHGIDMYVGVYRSAEEVQSDFESEFDEAVCVLSGQVVYHLAEGPVTIAEGQYAFVPKGITGRVEQSAGFKAFIVTLP